MNAAKEKFETTQQGHQRRGLGGRLEEGARGRRVGRRADRRQRHLRARRSQGAARRSQGRGRRLRGDGEQGALQREGRRDQRCRTSAKIFIGRRRPTGRRSAAAASPSSSSTARRARARAPVFGSIVLGGDKFVESQTEDNSGALVAKLKQTKGAISYLALSFADPELVTLRIKGGRRAWSSRAPTSIIERARTRSGRTSTCTPRASRRGPAKRSSTTWPRADFQEHVLPTVKGFIPITADEGDHATIRTGAMSNGTMTADVAGHRRALAPGAGSPRVGGGAGPRRSCSSCGVLRASRRRSRCSAFLARTGIAG